MTWTLQWGRWAASPPSPDKEDILKLCKGNVDSIGDLVSGGNLLKQRQCQDLSSKLSLVYQNVHKLVSHSGASVDRFRPALENLLRFLENAKELVRNCAEEDWCAASVSRIQNENAFREILHELAYSSLEKSKPCYEEIYELAKSTNGNRNDYLEDLRQSSVFLPALDTDVVKDREELNFLKPCEHIVRNVSNDLAKNPNLLNKRQCLDLSTKLLSITRSLLELQSYCGASALLFRPALKKIYRHLEKAKLLVGQCGEEDWCAAAVFQIQNENAFREILLDVCLCYNAIYEQVQGLSDNWGDLPEDLRKETSPDVFGPALDSDVVGDQQDLKQRLENLANDPKLLDHSLPEEVAVKQCLARYLLRKMHCASEHSHAKTLDTCSEILWPKDTEPKGTWGTSEFIAAGATDGYVCRTKWLGIPCAKKVILAKEHIESFFLKESGILAQLKHPCIINFFCCGNGEAEGDCFIAMELMEKSLSQLIEGQQGKHFPLPVVLDMIAQIARGMCYLHDRGIAHRDLKPQNVVASKYPGISDHFCVKLVDFGISKILVEFSQLNTMTSIGLGTTVYRAPEVHRDANLRMKGKVNWFKADVFSFSMTCAHLLCLKQPFGTTMPSKLYEELKNDERPNLPSYICPKEVAALLNDCWNFNPSLRPSFEEICTRLEKYRHGISSGSTPLNFSLEEKKIEFHLKEEKVHFAMGFESKTLKSKEQLIIPSTPFMHYTDDEAKGENIKIDTFPVISCTRGHALSLRVANELLYLGLVCCDICGEDAVGRVYHCQICEFDAHEDCAELKDEVKVPFHDHDPIHLLLQHYYYNNPNVICGFCEESLQDSEWVYRCEECNFDVHAFCTKYPKKRMHPKHPDHFLTLIQPPAPKSELCICCNGDVKGYYYICTQEKCAFSLHPFCAILPDIPHCPIGSSHEPLSLVTRQRGFLCAKCGSRQGLSWFYHCNSCALDIYLDSVGDMEELELHWNVVYEKFMLQANWTKGNHVKMDMITGLLDKLLVHNTVDASSSSSSRRSPSIWTSCAEIVKPTKKFAAKRQKLKAEMLKMLSELEGIVEHLRSPNIMSQADAKVLEAAFEELTRRHYIMQVENTKRMRQGPCIGLFYKWKHESSSLELLTSLGADTENVRLALLCEEPGHEHIVHGSQPRMFNGLLGERWQKLQPLLASGLPVVTRAIRASMPRLTRFDYVTTLPVLGPIPWDLRAIDDGLQGPIPCDLHPVDLVQRGKRVFEYKAQDEENVEVLNEADWFLSDLKNDGINSLKFSGLLPVRFTSVETFPRYSQYMVGTFAWLCTDHFNRGLKAGILEYYPVKQMYHNLEYDQHHQFI